MSNDRSISKEGIKEAALAIDDIVKKHHGSSDALVATDYAVHAAAWLFISGMKNMSAEGKRINLEKWRDDVARVIEENYIRQVDLL